MKRVLDSVAKSFWHNLGPHSVTRSLSSVAGNQQILLRDYIHDHLYNAECGYFNKQTAPVAPLPKPLDFASFLGKAAYQRAVQQAYQTLPVAWLTPSELFSPVYGEALARHVVHVHQARGGRQPLQVFELGGGTGTLALDFLNSIKQDHPEVYKSCSYTGCEISPLLARQQKDRVASAGGHAGRYNVEVRDAADAAAWGQPGRSHCFILGLELLDNCAHDKVVKGRDGSWMQEEIVLGEASPHLELTPLSDEWIQLCLECALACPQPSFSRWQDFYDVVTGSPRQARAYENEEVVFLPTKAAILFKTLLQAKPDHSVILADFSQLPDIQISGRNAPLVTAMIDGSPQDYPSYLVDRGSSDILFPTDFQLLKAIYRRLAGKDSSTKVYSTAQYMERYAAPGAARTRNGFCPLIEDFSNTSFFCANSKSP